MRVSSLPRSRFHAGLRSISRDTIRASLLVAALGLSIAPALSATSYTYDSLGRLIKVRYDNGKEITYTYDAAGNRVQRLVANAGANSAPVANPDSITLNEDQTSVTFNPRTNDTDPDNDALTLFSTGSGSLGTSALSGSGTTVTYTSTNKRTNSDTFVYVIRDPGGAEAYGQVTINFANLGPVAVNDAVTTNKNQIKIFDPRINDTDPGNDALTITSTSTPLHGTVILWGGGTSLYYTPTANYYGADSFTYTVADADGSTATATVNMTVNYGQSAPIANADTKTTTVNTAHTFDPRTNDSDPDGSTLTITAKTNGTKGTVAINSGTSLTYTPTTGQSGADSFTYTIADVDGQTATATVSMTIQAANSPPVAVNDSVELFAYYGSSPMGTIDPRWNDTDPDGNPLTITNVTQPSNGTATISGGGTSITITRSATCPGFNPQVGSVTYTISDGQGGTATGTITSTITCESGN
jgi:YD repeat-containing protein